MTSATEPKTIDLGGHCVQREGTAGQTITPGMLVAVAADGDVDFVTEGQECSAAFAVEFDETGRDIDDNYAVADQVKYKVFTSGSRVNAIIADGEDIAVGDKLTSNGDGALKEAGDTDFVIAEARAVAAPSGSTARCEVEIAPGRGIA